MNITRQSLANPFFLCCGLLFLAACAGNQVVAPIEDRTVREERSRRVTPPVPPKPAPAPAAAGPVVRALPDIDSPAARAMPLPEAGTGAASPAPLSPTMQPAPAVARAPAIAELIAKAERSSAQGELEVARANLERAVKIAPRDAELWQRLAMLSYAHGDWAHAKSLAERSNSFAAPGSALASRNWTLIGNAELKLGNQSAAAAAFERSAVPAP